MKKDLQKTKKDMLWRIYILYMVMLLFALAIVGKAIYIQYYEGPELISEVTEKRLKYETIEATRGNIYSCDGQLIATSVPLFDIRMDVASPHISDALFNKEIDSLALCLANLFGNKPARAYRNEISLARRNGNRYFLIKRKVTYDELNTLRTFPIFRRGKYRGGLIAEPRTKRELLYETLAARTIGYESENAGAYVGLEGGYSNYLKGKGGMRIMQKITRGVWSPLNDAFEIEPENGCDIITSIDMDIQDVAENALKSQLIEHDAHHGCAVLMEVKTGHVKAIANLTLTKSGDYEETYNYAVGESSEPGSTFKLMSLMAALEDNAFELNDSVETGDGWTVYHGRTMKDDHKIGDGWITVREAFEHSSNVGVSKLIYQTYSGNQEKFTERLYQFGIQDPLGIEIPGEGKPLIKNPNSPDWSKLSLPWMATGYEVQLTPLQILTFYNAVANDGKMLKPMFVKEVRKSGQSLATFDPIVINKSICSKKTITKAKQLLEGVVENGTAKNLSNHVYKIAGKTGTAQLAQGSSGYNKTDYKASFVGYFPADDPQYSCIVVINKPSKGYYYGTQVAGPVFREIADKIYATQMDVFEENDTQEIKNNFPVLACGQTNELAAVYGYLDNPVETENNLSDWSEVLLSQDQLDLNPISFNEKTVPDVKGMAAKDAVFLLESIGLSVSISGKGKVVKQSVAPGTNCYEKQNITLQLAVKK